jgi:transcriptional regulator with XRE-family HTH domain
MSIVVTSDEFKRTRQLMSGKVTQAELADLLGVSRSVVSMIESGQRSPTNDIATKLRLIAGDSTIREVRNEYAVFPPGLLTEVADFLIDYLSDPEAEDLRVRAGSILKRIPR